jgi:DegV family protein with EDD domain
MVQIITDTTAVLPPQIAAQYHILVIPQLISFGEESFAEGVDIDIETFMQKLKAARQLPKTAAPPPELFVQAFKRLVPLGEPILCIHPSAEVSGTVRSATVAARDFPGADIRVIDTRLIASPLGTVVQLAAQGAAAGLDADTIEARIKEMAQRCRIYFLVPTLEYLAKGGRIGGATALLGAALQIKPILTLGDGRVEPFEKERTMKKTLARLKALVSEQYPRQSEGYLTVMHGGVPEEAHSLASDLAQQLGLAAIPIFNLPPAIITHGGPGVLAVGFFGDQGESDAEDRR